jgi:hypothetical protein
MSNHEADLRALSFLRYLYGEINLDFKTIQLSTIIKNYNIPNYNVFCLVLTEKRIIFSKREGLRYKYKWNNEFNPNSELVSKIRAHMADYNRIRDNKKIPVVKLPKNPLGKDFKQIINEKKTELIPAKFTPKNENLFSKFVEELRASGVKGTINITISI